MRIDQMASFANLPNDILSQIIHYGEDFSYVTSFRSMCKQTNNFVIKETTQILKYYTALHYNCNEDIFDEKKLPVFAKLMRKSLFCCMETFFIIDQLGDLRSAYSPEFDHKWVPRIVAKNPCFSKRWLSPNSKIVDVKCVWKRMFFLDTEGDLYTYVNQSADQTARPVSGLDIKQKCTLLAENIKILEPYRSNSLMALNVENRWEQFAVDHFTNEIYRDSHLGFDVEKKCTPFLDEVAKMQLSCDSEVEPSVVLYKTGFLCGLHPTPKTETVPNVADFVYNKGKILFLTTNGEFKCDTFTG